MAMLGRRLTEAQKKRIRAIITDRESEDGPFFRQLAKKYGVSKERIRQIYRYGVYLQQQGKL